MGPRERATVRGDLGGDDNRGVSRVILDDNYQLSKSGADTRASRRLVRLWTKREREREEERGRATDSPKKTVTDAIAFSLSCSHSLSPSLPRIYLRG